MGKKKKAFEINFGTLLLIIIEYVALYLLLKTFLKKKQKLKIIKMKILIRLKIQQKNKQKKKYIQIM